MPPGFFLTQPRSLRPEASRFLPVPCCPTHPGLGLAQGSRLGRQTDLREAGPGLCLSAGSWPPAGRCSIRPWGPPGRRFGRDPWWIRGGPGRVLGSRPGNRDPQTQVGLRRSPFQPLAAGPPPPSRPGTGSLCWDPNFMGSSAAAPQATSWPSKVLLVSGKQPR